MYCTKCGKQLSNTERFCTGCGNPVQNMNNNQIIMNSNIQSQNNRPEEKIGVIYITAGVIAAILLLLVIFGATKEKDEAIDTNIDKISISDMLIIE